MAAADIPANSRGRCELSLSPLVQEGGLLPYRALDTLAGRPALATVVTGIAGVAAWVASVNWIGVATTIAGVLTIVVLGYKNLRQQLRTQQLKWEEENRETLTGQLEAAREDAATLNAKLVELTESMKAERKSLHAQRNEMQVQSGRLHEQLADVTDQLITTTRELTVANRKIGELMAEVEKLRLGTARQTTAVLKEVQGAKRDVKANAEAIAEIQRLSGDNLPASHDLRDFDTPPHGIPTFDPKGGPR